MTDLVSRLLEAIGETERLANGGEKWWAPPDLPGVVDTGIGGIDLDVKLPSYAVHIAHNDPSSALRRCAADRELIELCQHALTAGNIPAATMARLTLSNRARAYGLSDNQEGEE